MMKIFVGILLFSVTLTCSFGQTTTFDLVIKNANVFNSRTGKLVHKQTILIKEGVIAKVTSGSKHYAAAKTIDAGGKLVTPGFIDTHIHPTDVYRSYGPLQEYFAKDSLELYRKRLSDTYLPYGVTTAMILGQSEKWLPPILDWQNNPQPHYLNIYTVGGALVSSQSRKPYINHAMVTSPAAAREKVIAFYQSGIRHIKLYWKLRRPEFEVAFKTADSLGMKVYGHIDQNVMFIDTAFDIGLRNYEHVLTLVNSVLHVNSPEGERFNAEMLQQYGPGHANGQVERLEMFRFMHDKRPGAIDSLIDKLSKSNTTYSTSIHLMGEPFGLTYFTNQKDTTLTPAQTNRCKENFAMFMGYVKQLFDKGITLRMGTDWPSGGKVMLSEQLLLAEYGFTIPQILQISTINGATALGMDNKYGVIEEGKHADLLIWDKSPFDNYKHFLAGKTIIKDGIVFK
ncbi:imidazolonepropionase-like amidohydrolase [Filimonas zeae]|uniref:Amidohydrolase-related domain-containing protein n=1 Tax=Filimonas zeae TaxID=1737353 RepID=A0A917MTK2_9BACT|nr:amidohydrolase family protein [Filimonas zeae]MDR6338315.1 imidazolonepropionase-like amidohydrolase [Filimonas zeae]GGH62804.1 hypothetical protein GCM10011379_13090 [Filimonas zeae]